MCHLEITHLHWCLYYSYHRRGSPAAVTNLTLGCLCTCCTEDIRFMSLFHRRILSQTWPQLLPYPPPQNHCSLALNGGHSDHWQVYGGCYPLQPPLAHFPVSTLARGVLVDCKWSDDNCHISPVDSDCCIEGDQLCCTKNLFLAVPGKALGCATDKAATSSVKVLSCCCNWWDSLECYVFTAAVASLCCSTGINTLECSTAIFNESVAPIAQSQLFANFLW